MPARNRPSRWPERLARPVDASSLAVFRALFGLLVFIEVFGHVPQIHATYLGPALNFTYPGFGWVHPWPGDGMYLHAAVLMTAALGVAFGAWFRASSVVLAAGYAGWFLMDAARYENHRYLIVLLAVLISVSQAHRAWSVDRWQGRAGGPETVPQWNLLVLQAQLVLMYGFAGLAKLNPDWLAGEPLRHWLPIQAPAIGAWVAHPWAAYAMSYAGLAVDLGAPMLLLWPRTRPAGIGLMAAFHLVNLWLFADISVFPYLGLASCLLFVKPDAPRRLLARWLRRPAPPAVRPRPGKLSPWTAGFVAAYLGAQVLVPLRHLAIPGDVAWTEDGHRFAWRMKLRHKWARLRIFETDSRTGATRVVSLDRYLNRRQQLEMGIRPDLMVQFARYLKRERLAQGHPEPIITADSWVSLNYRPYVRFVHPGVNLAAEPLPGQGIRSLVLSPGTS